MRVAAGERERAHTSLIQRNKPLIRRNVWHIHRGNFRVGGRNNYLCKVDAKREISGFLVPAAQKSTPPRRHCHAKYIVVRHRRRPSLLYAHLHTRRPPPHETATKTFSGSLRSLIILRVRRPVVDAAAAATVSRHCAACTQYKTYTYT